MENIQDLYTKNSETLLREVKDLNTWKYNTIPIRCKSQYCSNDLSPKRFIDLVNPIQTPCRLFLSLESEKMNFIWQKIGS